MRPRYGVAAASFSGTTSVLARNVARCGYGSGITGKKGYLGEGFNSFNPAVEKVETVRTSLDPELAAKSARVAVAPAPRQGFPRHEALRARAAAYELVDLRTCRCGVACLE